MAEPEPARAINLRAVSNVYADDHPSWRDQVAQLAADLARLQRTVTGANAVSAGPVLRLETEAGPRQDGETVPTKGAVIITLLSLGSAQLIRSAALVVREWLRRDQSRSVSLEVTTVDGKVVAGGHGDRGIEAAERAFRAALEGHSPGEPDGER